MSPTRGPAATPRWIEPPIMRTMPLKEVARTLGKMPYSHHWNFNSDPTSNSMAITFAVGMLHWRGLNVSRSHVFEVSVLGPVLTPRMRSDGVIHPQVTVTVGGSMIRTFIDELRRTGDVGTDLHLAAMYDAIRADMKVNPGSYVVHGKTHGCYMFASALPAGVEYRYVPYP